MKVIGILGDNVFVYLVKYDVLQYNFVGYYSFILVFFSIVF